MPIEREKGSQNAEVVRMKERLSRFETEDGRLKGLAYQPRPNDVGISTTPKAGTTWMQQICHQLRCAVVGDYERCMDFAEISEAVPWIELAHDQNQDLQAEQPPLFGHSSLPRFFKTHCWYDHCPNFFKTIVVLRDPCDVLVSFYKFFQGWYFEPGAIDLETFANEFWLARDVPESKMQNASYFVHLVSWYRHRNDDGVLVLLFEDMKDDLEGQVRRIAKFLSNQEYNFDTHAVIQHAFSHSTFDFMKKHEDKFDEKLSKLSRNEACGLPRDAGMSKSKLHAGHSGKGSLTLSTDLKDKIDQKWKEVVLPITGCASYAELRVQLASECATFLAHNDARNDASREIHLEISAPIPDYLRVLEDDKTTRDLHCL